jgi:hypothetical protein
MPDHRGSESTSPMSSKDWVGIWTNNQGQILGQSDSEMGSEERERRAGRTGFDQSVDSH